MTTPTKLRRFDAANYLDTPADIAHYLQAALEENDPAFFLVALGTAARACGMSSVAAKTKLGRESLYKALAPGGNPHFTTVLSVLHSLDVRLCVTPRTSRRSPRAQHAAPVRQQRRPGARARASAAAVPV